MMAWDRTQDWIIERYRHDLTRVTILFRQPIPSVAELAAVRRCLPQFRNTSPASLRTAISDSGTLPLGLMPSQEARTLVASAESNHLQVFAEDASFVSYLPFNRKAGYVWLIENTEEAAAVSQDMIASGVPVRDAVDMAANKAPQPTAAAVVGLPGPQVS
jgi:hypothetical protein